MPRLRAALRGAYLLASGQALGIAANALKQDKQKRALRIGGAIALTAAIEACRREGLRPFLTFGTLLGCVRDNAFIPNDNDIDLGLILEPGVDTERLARSFQIFGFDIRQHGRLTWPLSSIGHTYMFQLCHVLTHVMVDIYFFHTYRDRTVFLDSRDSDYLYREQLRDTDLFVDSQRAAGYAMDYPSEIFSALHETQFMGTRVFLPALSEQWLELTYGKGWKVPSKRFRYENLKVLYPSPPEADEPFIWRSAIMKV